MNKKHTYVWVSLIILIFGIIVIPTIIDRIKRGTIVENDRMAIADKSAPLAYVTYDGEKRKVPPFELINQDSLLISDKDYLGKVYVVEFFFTRCPAICPIMTENLVALQEEFEEEEDFGIASFSITPEYDTPRVLKQYAEKHGVENMDWHFMTGDKEKIYSLANDGFNIFAAENPDAPGGFEHSGLFALIDREGYIRSRTDGYGNPIIYYRGAITEDQGENDHGEKEQISILKKDIEKLLQE
ncbi:SCO family protein [Pricia sp. S334]|uniref:SCO family protein n=1 Tax=Pricia mediterranea TaxID=3076079 RepID=A0ABU3L782_9FLAO|nr:SCO family protein [Pricia sp. S334]MDT7829530.1 SCO family protein [Pricia sp. S334]